MPCSHHPSRPLCFAFTACEIQPLLGWNRQVLNSWCWAGRSQVLINTCPFSPRSPIPLGSVVLVDSKVDRMEGRKVFLSCQVWSADGQTLHAEATGKDWGDRGKLSHRVSDAWREPNQMPRGSCRLWPVFLRDPVLPPSLPSKPGSPVPGLPLGWAPSWATRKAGPGARCSQSPIPCPLPQHFQATCRDLLSFPDSSRFQGT